MRNRIFNWIDSKIRSPAWVMGGTVVLAFIAAPIVDIDHPVAWMLGIPDERFVMAYFDTVSHWAIGCGLILAVSCVCRCAWVRFLRRR